MVAGNSWLPTALAALGTSPQVLAKEPIEMTVADLEFIHGIPCGDGLGAKTRHHITNERCGVPPSELLVLFSSGQS
jgi:hypothetical protein